MKVTILGMILNTQANGVPFLTHFLFIRKDETQWRLDQTKQNKAKNLPHSHCEFQMKIKFKWIFMQDHDSLGHVDNALVITSPCS